MWTKEKLLVTSNFSFSHVVFKSCLLLMGQNEYLWSKGLKCSVILIYSVHKRSLLVTNSTGNFTVKTKKKIKPFIKRLNFRLVQIERIFRQQIKCNLRLEIGVGKGRKHCGKTRKCWLPAFYC